MRRFVTLSITGVTLGSASAAQARTEAQAAAFAPAARSFEAAMLAAMQTLPDGVAQSSSAMNSGDDDLQVAITPGVFLARLGGESRFGDAVGVDDLSLESDLDLDDLEPSAAFEMAITKGQRWQVDLSGFDFSTDASGTLGTAGVFGEAVFAAGDAYEASFDMTSLAMSVSYWQWRPIDSVERGGPLDLRLAWGGGLRWLSVEQGLELPGAAVAEDADGEWIIPEAIVQLDLNYRLPDSAPVLTHVQVLALAGVGPALGGDGGMVVTFRAGMRFWIGHTISFDFGYRLIEAGVEYDSYELVGGLQGLFLSGTIRF